MRAPWCSCLMHVSNGRGETHARNRRADRAKRPITWSRDRSSRDYERTQIYYSALSRAWNSKALRSANAIALPNVFLRRNWRHFAFSLRYIFVWPLCVVLCKTFSALHFGEILKRPTSCRSFLLFVYIRSHEIDAISEIVMSPNRVTVACFLLRLCAKQFCARA